MVKPLRSLGQCLSLFLCVIPVGCGTTWKPSPGDTLCEGCRADMAHYRFHAPGGDYGHRDLLGQVFFAFDGATIGAEDKELLRGIAAELNAHPERTVTLIGYSDWQGQEKYNLRLSQKRADVVAEFLRSEGVAPDHIHTDARGAQDSPEGLAKNQARFDRRVDILSH